MMWSRLSVVLGASLAGALLLSVFVALPARASVSSLLAVTAADISRAGGALYYDVDVDVDSLTGSGVCDTGYPSCQLYIQGRLADDFAFYGKSAGDWWTIFPTKTLWNFNFPGSFNFSYNDTLPRIDAVRVVLDQGGSTLESYPFAVSDPYPADPAASIAIHHIARQANGDFAFDVTSAAATVLNGEMRPLARDRTAWWLDGMVVIRDLSTADGGSAFIPGPGYEYFLGLN